MSGLELRFLGEVEVRRDGELVSLPPSKKTRALLAYLALVGRAVRRDHLCELLWELPDDPRGSLRWSLSKLRRLVDDDDATRIVADRSQVSFADHGVSIDVQELRTLVEGGLDALDTETLEAAANRHRGHFLEGLDLTQQQSFYAWCVSERDSVATLQKRILAALVERLSEDPTRSLRYARELVLRSPYDEESRADLIRLLVRSGRSDEAEQQYRMGIRLLKEVGATSRGLLAEARHEPPDAPAPAPIPAAARRPGARTVAPMTEHLVGRNVEIEGLQRTFEEVRRQGRARVMLYQGEPGMGKSRILAAGAELAREAGAHLLEASAFESDSLRPFAMWIDALRRLRPEAELDVFDAARRDDRDQLFDGLTRLIEKESAARPVVLVFDDLQWCDESSAAALHYVMRMNRDRPLFGILAAREEELTDNTSAQQALRGLRRDRLLEDVRLAPLPDEAIEQIIATHRSPDGPAIDSRECQGNPLLAIELARSPRTGEVGGSLQELIRERLARLELDGADLLRWAAIVEPRIEAATLARLTGLDANRIGEILESAQRIALLQPDERGFRFSHGLIASYIYHDIAPARRKVMHGRVAEILEQAANVDLDRAAALAHHASLCGDPAQAARAMVLAGRLCLRFFANDDALALSARGLRWAEQLSDGERVRLTIDLRDIALAAAPVDDWEQAAREYVDLAEQALDHGALGHARLGYHMASYLRWMHGQWSHARRETLQAERVVRGGSEADHIVGLAETAKCLAMLERDLSDADAMLMEASALASRERLLHHAIPAARGMLHFHRGELDEAEESFLEARTLCKSAGERIDEFQASEYLVLIDLERGRFAPALERCRALVEVGERIREGSEAPFAHALAGLCRYALEDDPEALDAAIDALREADAKHRLACASTRAALLDVERGRHDRAIERATEALQCAEVLERPTDIALARTALALACAGAGDEAAAARHREAIAALDPATVARWALERAALVPSDDARTGDRRGARRGRT